MSRSNRLSWATLDPTLWVAQNIMETTSNLTYRSAKWFKNQKNQIEEVFKSIPWNKRYNKIWNIPLGLINGVLVPANAILWIWHKWLQWVTAIRRLIGNWSRFLQKTILWQDVIYKPLLNMTPNDRLSKNLSSWLKIKYFGESAPATAATTPTAPAAPTAPVAPTVPGTAPTA